MNGLKPCPFCGNTAIITHYPAPKGNAFFPDFYIASCFKEMRERAGLTQEQVADHFGIDHSSVVGWEADKWFPKADRLIQLSTLYKCTMEELIFGSKGRKNAD